MVYLANRFYKNRDKFILRENKLSYKRQPTGTLTNIFNQFFFIQIFLILRYSSIFIIISFKFEYFIEMIIFQPLRKSQFIDLPFINFKKLLFKNTALSKS
ncbi:hypothetical protein SAMN02746065_12418 [Desulfocicer vacuolatum DSM 3385]|uniref:Transmembrane protein n=1 Tax=Desulfocicer vacuolatum DSM 3385 TaxID=1121400 RepID=A0A1W2E458_9BACT|nr:hypothetical protein SAMN02746065_12418 [Desulfocicer vacuolatum DSM 3385]